MFSEIELSNFKCHRSLKATLRAANIFVGPNNSGKSTIIDAFRVLRGCMGTFRSRVPWAHRNQLGEIVWGFEVPISTIPIDLAHIASEYSDDPAEIRLRWTTGGEMRMLLRPDTAVSVALTTGSHIRSRVQFDRMYPLSVTVVPYLGPFEQRETWLADKTVSDGIGTRLAHRHFRNYWYRQPEGLFEIFRRRVQDSWPGIDIHRSERSGPPDPILNMFFSENRFDREIAWSGIGLQIWLQILTNILHQPGIDCVIIDEPDIYLHPDMQKRLLTFLRDESRQFIMATHSPEIINDARKNKVVSVEKGRRSIAKRITDVPGLQKALISVGSNDNIELSKLSRARRIIFFEGGDKKFIVSFARRLGLGNVLGDNDSLFLRLGGFSKAPRIEAVSYTFREIIGERLQIFAMFDRDYRSDEEVGHFLAGMSESGAVCEVFSRKEVENYLLVPEGISEALTAKMRAVGDRGQPPTVADVAACLDREASAERWLLYSQYQAHRRSFLRDVIRDHRSEATIDHETFGQIEAKWIDPASRYGLLPGKEVLTNVRRWLHDTYGRSVTSNEIIQRIPDDRLDPELTRTMKRLDEFCAA